MFTAASIALQAARTEGLRAEIGKKIWVQFVPMGDWTEVTLTALPAPGLITVTYLDPYSAIAAGDHSTRTVDINDVGIRFPISSTN